MPYLEEYASYYDVFYSEKDYHEESDFIHACLEKFLPGIRKYTILELACGTGNHALALSERGHEITATDRSEDMLRIARSKAGTKNPNLTFQQMDMLSFAKFQKPFDVVMCLFDSIGYVRSNQNIATVLKQVRKNLQPGGLFIFEFWNAGAMLRLFEPSRERIFQIQNKTIRRVSETSLHYAKQLARVEYSIFEKEKEGERLAFKEIHENRFFLIQEMEGLLSDAGFSSIGYYPGFQFSGAVTESTWHTVAVCKTTIFS